MNEPNQSLGLIDKTTKVIYQSLRGWVRKDFINSDKKNEPPKYQIMQIKFRTKAAKIQEYILSKIDNENKQSITSKKNKTTREQNKELLYLLQNVLQIQQKSREQVQRIFLSALNDRKAGKISTIIINKVMYQETRQLFWLLIDYIKEKIKYIITKFTFPPISPQVFDQILIFQVEEQNKKQILKIKVDFTKYLINYQGYLFLLVIPELDKQSIKEMVLYKDGGNAYYLYYFQLNEEQVRLIRSQSKVKPDSILEQTIRNFLQTKHPQYKGKLCFSISNIQN